MGLREKAFKHMCMQIDDMNGFTEEEKQEYKHMLEIAELEYFVDCFKFIEYVHFERLKNKINSGVSQWQY